MSHYGDYIRERLGDEIIETSDGFITYRYISAETCYIVELYVVPEKREQYVATALAEMVRKKAKERGATELLGTVVPTTSGATTALKVLLGYGMRLKSSADNLIVLAREV